MILGYLSILNINLEKHTILPNFAKYISQWLFLANFILQGIYV